MSRNYVDENGNLIQIAGKGIGVAEWGTPIENWLTNATSAESAKLADKDGVLVHSTKADSNLTRSMKVYDNDVQIYLQTNNYGKTCTIPIIKGHKYYYTSENGSIESSVFYPFKENNNLQMVREKYSTEETVIGKWIDGKPLYRKVINFSYARNFTNGDFILSSAEVNSMNVDMIIKAFAWKSNKCVVVIHDIYVSSGGFKGWNGASDASGMTSCCIEYTKTTD